jgi:hypothetical protein
VQAFPGDRALTTTELRSELPDVPPASLYRHVARLVDAGVLAVQAERRVGGAVERTYVLRVAAANPGISEQLAEMSVEDHRQASLASSPASSATSSGTLATDDVDLERDGVAYRLIGLRLDDVELVEFLGEIADLFRPRLANAPAPGRKRRILASILLPGDEANAAKPC